MTRTHVLLLCSTLALSNVAHAAAPDPDPADGAKPSIRAVRIETPIRIDGRLDDAAWERAVPVAEFTQISPDEGEPVSERTEARILYDDEALYVGVRLWDSAPPTSRLGRRDMPIAGDSDWFGVMLDSDRDRRTAFGFDVNPAGVRRDEIKTINTDDNSWDPVWEVATTVDGEGWTAEYRIPFSQLRFRGLEEQTWGIQLERLIARKGEYAASTFISRSGQGGVPEYGALVGLSDIRTGKRLEATPYLLARSDAAAAVAPEHGGAFGLDLQYRVTSELTLNATLNPDFGQVELDPAVVNLSAYETFYEEKRPFFVEGAGIFDFGRDAVGPGSTVRGLFYSRRIGRAPQVGGAGDAPDATTILGAAKLTGRTAGGWSVGIMEAATQPEWVAYTDEAGAGREELAEPFTNYLVARARRQMRSGQSAVGAIFTSVNRSLETEAAAERLGSAAYAGGIDFRHEWGDRTWSVSGFLSGSHVLGGTDAISRLQRSPARYYHRPDAEHLTYDPTATSLSGYAGQLQLRKQGGRHWRGDVGLFAASPGYEINDIGFLARTDARGANASLSYLERTPGDLVRSYHIMGQAIYAENFGGTHVDDGLVLAGMWQFQNFWSANVTAIHTTESVSDRQARGGPLVGSPAETQVDVRAASDPRRPVSASASVRYSADEAGGGTRKAQLSATLRPSPRWKLEIGPQLLRRRVASQYVTTLADPAATGTFGHRYLFAELDQTTASLDMRLDVTFTPELTLELFAQPFLTGVSYGDPVELRAPGTRDFRPYAGPAEVPDRDFNLRSLRGNAVLRWEWSPGSTLYLAWQQRREDFAPGIGDFDFARDRSALFRTRPDNVLMLKVDYWLNF